MQEEKANLVTLDSVVLINVGKVPLDRKDKWDILV